MNQSLFVLTAIVLLSCEKVVHIKTKKLVVKGPDITMYIPYHWKLKFSVGFGDRYTEYHWLYSRSDDLGKIDIKTKTNNYYTYTDSNQKYVVSTSKVMQSELNKLKPDSSYFKHFTIIEHSNKPNYSSIIYTYFIGKREKTFYSLLVVKRNTQVTKILKVDLWGTTKEEEQLNILKTIHERLSI